MIWAALSMTAALVMTACSNDDNTVETPAAQQAIVKTIPYSVTVNGGAGTRATVDNDMKTLKFATGDKLYITGTNISGVLALKSGDESKSSGATFEGDLTYTGAGSPASDLALTATLVSAQQTDGTEVTINSTTKAVTVNYPTTAYCADVATAVQKYSNLTGTSTYSAKSFTLSQNTAFLNFEITFVDGTTTGTELSAVVKNGATNLCTANVTTTTVDTKVVAKFVLPVAKNTALSGATVTMGDKAARAINDATLDGKVYNVKKTQKATATAHALSASVLGDVIDTNGNAYTLDDTHELPSGVTAVAMVAYLGNDAETSPTNTAFKNGLALALEDVSDKKTWCSQTSATCLGTQYDSDTKFNDLAGIANTDALVGHAHTHAAASAARNYNSGTHPAGTSAWFLPSAGQWDKMIGSTGLGLSNLGLLANVSYWSSTEDGAYRAWGFNSYNGYWANSGSGKGVVFQVRACLAF